MCFWANFILGNCFHREIAISQNHESNSNTNSQQTLMPLDGLTLHCLNLFRNKIIIKFTNFLLTFLHNNLVFWFTKLYCNIFCIMNCVFFSCTKYILDEKFIRNKLRQELAFEVGIIQIFCNIMNVKCYLWNKVFVFCTRIGEQWPEWQKELGGRWPLQWQKPWTPVLKIKNNNRLISRGSNFFKHSLSKKTQ